MVSVGVAEMGLGEASRPSWQAALPAVADIVARARRRARRSAADDAAAAGPPDDAAPARPAGPAHDERPVAACRTALPLRARSPGDWRHERDRRADRCPEHVVVLIGPQREGPDTPGGARSPLHRGAGDGALPGRRERATPSGSWSTAASRCARSSPSGATSRSSPSSRATSTSGRPSSRRTAPRRPGSPSSRSRRSSSTAPPSAPPCARTASWRQALYPRVLVAVARRLYATRLQMLDLFATEQVKEW